MIRNISTTLDSRGSMQVSFGLVPVVLFLVLGLLGVACGDNGGQLSNTEIGTACMDGEDNDVDGLVDCADPDCDDEAHCANNDCGNGTCDPEENSEQCPEDCLAGCGDGECAPWESAANCPADCDGVVCGDDICASQESATTCPEDCACGNGVCDDFETQETCAQDCTPTCEDGVCQAGESYGTCPQDCYCGNGTCDLSENATSCSVDCESQCGDGLCEFGVEDYTTCDLDCFCSNGTCDFYEDSNLCVEDCAPLCGNGSCDYGENAIHCPGDCGGNVCDSVEDLIYQTGCPLGFACTVSQSGVTCMESGHVPYYELCSSAYSCQASSVCAPYGPNANQSICAPYCDFDFPGGCPGDGVCAVFMSTGVGDVGLCVWDDGCDPVTAAGCDVGEACTLFNEGVTSCIAAGPQGVADSCSYGADCGLGMYCSTGGTCIEFCYGSNDCSVGTCQYIGQLSPDLPTLGACQ